MTFSFLGAYANGWLIASENHRLTMPTVSLSSPRGREPHITKTTLPRVASAYPVPERAGSPLVIARFFRRDSYEHSNNHQRRHLTGDGLFDRRLPVWIPVALQDSLLAGIQTRQGAPALVADLEPETARPGLEQAKGFHVPAVRWLHVSG